METQNGWFGRCRVGAALTLLWLLAAHRVDAESVYKCRDASGHLAYQDHACANTQQETRVDIAPAPPVSASPEYGVTRSARMPSPRASARKASRRGDAGPREVVSFECRASNGEVFYRHSGCPKSIKAGGAASSRGSKQGTQVAVSAAPLARSEACRRLAAGGFGRAGHERDEQVSTYDRNAGRDPCRRF
jgi:hypothetical protein